MRVLAAFVLAMCFPAMRASSQATDRDYKDFYEQHRWFALRDAVDAGRGNMPALYRAAVEAAFDERALAERDLRKITSTSPNSADAYEAQEVLATLYFRHGEYRQGLLCLRAMLKLKPDAEDVKNAITVYTPMAQADQRVAQLVPSQVQLIRGEGNLYLPRDIDGKSASYAFDTGANYSAISESEAKRLGMELVGASGQIEDSSGHQLGLRVAVAKNLYISGLHLRSVAFAVLPDSQPPFNDLPQQKRGLIGIPVLLAMRTFRWSTDGSFALGFPSQHFELKTANLSFEQSFPITQVGFEGRNVDFTVDSGAQRTVMNPPFSVAFESALKPLSTPETYKLTGVGGSSGYASLLIPSLKLTVGGQMVKLTNAHVLTQESSNESKWAFGNLGIDLLNEANATIFDFRAMKLTLENQALAPESR